MSGITCCLNCEVREIGCHARCEKYKTAKAEHNRVLEKIYKERLLDGNFSDAVIRQKERKRKSGK